jgi:translation initiation factor eIF-2B subunit alpha
VDIVLVGTEAVVESGGLVSRVGTSQCAHLARAMGKPFYALAESYKFLRYYPLKQSDLPMPKRWGRRIPLEFDEMEEEEEDDDDVDGSSRYGFARGGSSSGHGRSSTQENTRSRLPRATTTAPATPRRVSLSDSVTGPGGTAAGALANTTPGFDVRWEMTKEMEEKNPLVDITGPELVDLVITDLGTISATAISQYLVALFSS